MNKLVVLGSVNADHVLRVPHFPRPGETLVGHNYQVIPGGKGANQAVAAARLGADIAFIATIGDDSFGDNIKAQFIADNMNIQAVTQIPNTPTGIAMIQVSDEGENSIAISSEANAYLDINIVKHHQDLIKNAQYLLMQLETPIDAITLAAKIAHSAGTLVTLNPAPAQALCDDLLANIDMITPNETEAQVLTGVTVSDEKSAQQAADILHQKGISKVMITLGSKGVWLSETGEKGAIYPGFKVKAIDTTAAGDTFNGALLCGLIEGKSMPEAITFAHAAAAISVTKNGAQTSIPSRAQVDVFLQ